MPAIAKTYHFSPHFVDVADGCNVNFDDIVLYVNNRNDGTTAWDLLRVTASPTTSIAAIISNSTGTADIANFRDDTTNVLTIADGGVSTFTANGGTGVALTANNGTSTGVAFQAQDNGTNILACADGGATTITATAGGSSVPLTVNNSTSTGSIFVAQDNGAAVFTITDGAGTAIFNSTGLGIGVTPTANEGRLQVFANGDQTNENTAAMLIGDRATNGMRIFFTVQNTDNWCGISSVESGIAYRPLVLQYNGGNVKIGGAANRTTDGTALIALFNGTAPAGALTNGVSIYSAAGELNVMDAGGTATLLSPHDKETGEWIFRSNSTLTGKVLKIKTERMLRRLDEMLGGGYIDEYFE